MINILNEHHLKLGWVEDEWWRKNDEAWWKKFLNWIEKHNSPRWACFCHERAIGGKIFQRLRKRKDWKKLVVVNVAYDTSYSLNITLMTYMKISNKCILDTKQHIIYVPLRNYWWIFVIGIQYSCDEKWLTLSHKWRYK